MVSRYEDLDRANLEGQRQPFSVGDEYGQLVQAVKPLPTQQATVNWTQEQALTVSSTVVQLDQAFRLSNNYCYISVESASIRYWVGGLEPSATTGHQLDPGDVLVLESADELNDIQFIRRDGVDATLNCSFGNRS